MREIEMRMQPTQVSDIHTSKGNQLKWEQDGYWYKADAFGYESLAEVVCSRILLHSNLPRPVNYEPVMITYHGNRYRGCRSRRNWQRRFAVVLRRYPGRMAQSTWWRMTPLIISATELAVMFASA